MLKKAENNTKNQNTKGANRNIKQVKKNTEKSLENA